MTDIRQLLQQSAAVPSAPLRVTDVERRAAKRGLWRRLTLALAGLTTLAGVLIGGRLGVSPASRSEIGREVHGTEATATPVERGAPGSRAGFQASQLPMVSPATDVRRQVVVPTPTPQPGSAGGDFADSCTVAPPPDVIVAGFGPASNTCRYTASKPGGYQAQGVWDIRIERGNSVIVRSSASGDAPCSASGFIHAGDVVTATVDKDTVQSGYSRIWVGNPYHC